MSTAISGLPDASLPLTGTELVPLVQGGVTVKSTVDDLGTALSDGFVTLYTAQAITGQKTFTAPLVSSGTGDTGAIQIIPDPLSSTGSVMQIVSDHGLENKAPFIILDSSNPQLTMPGSQVGSLLSVSSVDSFGVVSLGYTAPPVPAYTVQATTTIPVVIKVGGTTPPTAWVELGLNVVLTQDLAVGTATITFEGIFNNPTNRIGDLEFGLKVNGTVLSRDIIVQISANFTQTIGTSLPLINPYVTGDDIRLVARVTANNNDQFSLTMENSVIDIGVMRIATTGNSSSSTFIQAGTGAVTRTSQNKMRERISIDDYGADPTGATDSTAAFNAAYAYIKTLGGGEIHFPGKLYKLNILIDSENVTLTGAQNLGASALQTGLQAFNPAIPVVTIGVDSVNVRHVVIENFSLRAVAGSTIGFDVAGSNRVTLRNCYTNAFTVTGLQLRSTATKSASYIYMQNCSFFGSNTVSANAVQVMKQGAGAVTAFFFDNCNFSVGTAGGQALYLDGDVDGFLSNCWITGANNQGIEFTDVGGRLKCSNVSVDSNSSSDILLTIPTDDSISTYLTGTITIDGMMKALSGNSNSLSGRRPTTNTLLQSPVLETNLQFCDSALAGYLRLGSQSSTYRIYRSGTSIYTTTDGAVVDQATVTEIRSLAGTEGRLRFGSSAKSSITSGAGSPEGVVASAVGSLYLNNTGALGSLIYVKQTGTGMSGWTVVI